MSIETSKPLLEVREKLSPNAISIIGLSSYELAFALKENGGQIVSKPPNYISYRFILGTKEFPYLNMNDRIESAIHDATDRAQKDKSIPLLGLVITPKNYTGYKTQTHVFSTKPVPADIIITLFDVEQLSAEESTDEIKRFLEDNVGRITQKVKDFAKPQRPHQV